MTNSSSVPDRAACLEPMQQIRPLRGLSFRGHDLSGRQLLIRCPRRCGSYEQDASRGMGTEPHQRLACRRLDGFAVEAWRQAGPPGRRCVRRDRRRRHDLVNLFKLIAAALAMRPDRPVILSTSDNFPTDLYGTGASRPLRRGHKIEVVAPDDLIAAIDEKTALVILTEVDFKSATCTTWRRSPRRPTRRVP